MFCKRATTVGVNAIKQHLKRVGWLHGKRFKLNLQNLFSLMSSNGIQLKLFQLFVHFFGYLSILKNPNIDFKNSPPQLVWAKIAFSDRSVFFSYDIYIVEKQRKSGCL